jgi:hypothetical protein
VSADFASNGIIINNKSTHVTLTDIRIHGFSKAGILGAPGDGFVADDLAIIGNADSGWNADDGSHSTGKGSFVVHNYDISWNGCVEEYPVTHKIPYGDCTDQDHGGYGDGFGTASLDSDPPGWHVTFDEGTVSYNTQDGLDALHIGGQGSSMTVTHTRAFSNMGQQIKVGGATATITDSLIVGNCMAMSENIPDTPPNYNSNLDLFCRAGDTAVLINVPDAQPAIYERNIMYSNNKVGLEIEYPGNPSSKAAIRYDDNIFVGFKNRDGEFPDPIYSNSDLKMFTNPGGSFHHNTTFRAKNGWKCPATWLHETAGNCGDPHLKDETWHPYGFGDAPRTTSDIVNHSENQPSWPNMSSGSSVAMTSLGAAFLAGGVWQGLRYLRARSHFKDRSSS